MLSCCFEAFSVKFTENSLFSQKSDISERNTDILGKFVFLSKFEKEQIQRKIRICCKQPFLFKAVKQDKYKQKCFSHQNLPHTAKLCFPVILKHFRWNSLKTSLFSQKKTLSEKAQKNLESCFFSTSSKRNKSRGKLGFVVNNPFCSKQ